ncbi:hypothetical protein BGZ65_001873, partial [Modicella reniformis]
TTHGKREKRREPALAKAAQGIKLLEDRVRDRAHIRKHQFSAVIKNLNAAFCWTMEDRAALATYLRRHGWSVRECELEADPEIAKDVQAGDVVLSQDSDFIVYPSVETVWRPISKGRFLVYKIPDILTTLEITRTQLTTLGFVSSNDYNSNIPTLGCSTNSSIIRSLDGGGISYLFG